MAQQESYAYKEDAGFEADTTGANHELEEDASSFEDESERMEKLRLANEVLRKQLKDFGRAFEATLNSSSHGKGGKPQGGGGRGLGEDGRKSLRALVASKQRQVQNLTRKMDNYKKSNAQLRRQIQEAYTSDRVLQMGNENLDKQRQIETLTEENRSLRALQRSQAKKLSKSHDSREEWPSRLTALQDELRVTQETLRKYKDKARVAEEDTKRQREHIMKLAAKNKDLNAEIKRYEAANGKAKTREEIDLEGEQASFEEQRRKLEHALHVLEKSNKQERIKAHQAVKKAEEQVKEHEHELKRYQDRVEQKEKDMRYQIVEIKKLKRGLRELAMGDAPLPIGDAPWSSGMKSFLDAKGDEKEAEAKPEKGKGEEGPRKKIEEVPVEPTAESSPKASDEPVAVEQPPTVAAAAANEKLSAAVEADVGAAGVPSVTAAAAAAAVVEETSQQEKEEPEKPAPELEKQALEPEKPALEPEAPPKKTSAFAKPPSRKKKSKSKIF